MSDENKKSDADDKTEEKLEATKKPAAKKKVKAKSKDTSADDSNKNKVIEKLQAMGVMSGGNSKEEQKSDPGKGEFLKIAVASAVAVLVVGSFVWALNEEASNDQTASKFNNAPQSSHHAMQSNYPSQWGPHSANQNNGRNFSYNKASFENNRKNFEKQQQRMKEHREQQQKWMQQQQQKFEQQQAQRQKWIEQQNKVQADYQAQQKKWVNQQRTQQQARPQFPMQQQQMAAHQQQWMEQQRAEQKRYQEQQLAQQKRLQEQQRAQQQKWREQAYNSFPPQMNYQGQPGSPAYNNVPGYQQPAPYNYYGR